MSFDRDALARAIAAHGPVARVVVAATRGSVPREAGAAMLVWEAGQSGTIGGGALEFEAAARARAALRVGLDRTESLALGPGLGQCCGGAVTLWTEIWDDSRLAEARGPVVARGPGDDPPLPVVRLLRRARGEGVLPRPGLVSGWLVEPVCAPARRLWIWGAGHVGRDIAQVLAPLPGLQVTLCDTAQDRLPPDLPAGVAPLIFGSVAEAVAPLPRDGEHLVLSYSHALDLELCDALLRHGFSRAGLIGSATKWVRFRGRLRALGHPDAEILRIRCPIGDPGLGKHPRTIAIGVAAQIVKDALRLAEEPAPTRNSGETG